MTCQCDLAAGSRACHCRLCCVTFGGLGAFDRHIRWDAGVPRHRSPQESGLTEVRPGVWGRSYGPQRQPAGASGEAAA